MFNQNPIIMDQKQIAENNALIAKFMGLDVGHDNFIPINGVWTKIKYHSSWDWLMPVIDKIEAVEMDEGYWSAYPFSFDMGRSWCFIKVDGGHSEEVVPGSRGEDNRVLHAYTAVVQFIKWLDEN